MKTMIKHNKKIILSLVSLFLLSSCGNKTRLKTDPSRQSFEVVEGIGFKEVFEGVIENNCLECHKSYAQFEVSSALASKMLTSIVTGRMPKGKPALGDKEKALLSSWIEAGTPEISGGEAPKPFVLEPNYKSLFIGVIAPKCIGCHSGEASAPAPKDMNFSTYETFLEADAIYKARNGFGLIDANTENSDLVFIVTDTGPGGQPMPPLSINGLPDYVFPGAVTEEELEVIKEWMRIGAPKE